MITPTEVAGLTIASNVLAADSSPKAATEVGQDLSRDTAPRADAALRTGLNVTGGGSVGG